MGSRKLLVLGIFLLTLVLLLAFEAAARELLDVTRKTDRQLIGFDDSRGRFYYDPTHP